MQIFNIIDRFKIILTIIILFKIFSTSANIIFNDDNKINLIFRNLNIKQTFDKI